MSSEPNKETPEPVEIERGTLSRFINKMFDAILAKLGAPQDPKTQYEFLTDPPNIQTMTYLKPSQVTFVTVAEWCATDHPVAFSAFGTWSKELMESMKSEQGRGIDAVIRYEQSKRAPPSSPNVNVFSQAKEKAGKIKEKLKGSESDG